MVSGLFAAAFFATPFCENRYQKIAALAEWCFFFCNFFPKCKGFTRDYIKSCVLYFAMLTRSFLYSDMEQSLYLKLAKFLSMCTPGELEFLQGVNYEDKIANSMMSASLYQYGLLMLEYQQDGRALFVLSDFGKALKQNSLNFDDGVSGHKRLVSYDSMSPAELQGFATNDDIEKLFQNQELILDGGSACGLPWE